MCKNACGRPAPIGRKECETCRTRKKRQADPILFVFYWLKKSAKKRGLSFTIEINWFRTWIAESDYMDGRGWERGRLNIDRIDNTKGYEPDNLQVIEKVANIKKYHYEDTKRELGPQYEPEDLPF